MWCKPWQDRGTLCGCACTYVCVTWEDYLRDGFNKTDAIVSSFDLNQAVAKVIPVVFSLAKKGCLLFLVKLSHTNSSMLKYPQCDMDYQTGQANI